MKGAYVTEDEARKMLFSPDARPTLSAFGRMRRNLNLPHLTIGRKIVYDMNELKEHLEEIHHQPPKVE